MGEAESWEVGSGRPPCEQYWTASHSSPCNSISLATEIQILSVELDGVDGIMVRFSDRTITGYVVEELLDLRPVRERVRIKKTPGTPIPLPAWLRESLPKDWAIAKITSWWSTEGTLGETESCEEAWLMVDRRNAHGRSTSRALKRRLLS